MSIKSSIILCALSCISQSKKFLPTGFPTGGDLNDASISTHFEIDINEETTTITIYSHELVWYGIGFGGVRMADVNYAVIYEGIHGSNLVIADQQISGQGQGTRLGTDLWTLDLYDTSSIPSGGPVMIQFTRDNDVSDVCPQCYTFDPDAESLQIILAKGTSETYGYHGNGLNKRGETITALADTDFPTDFPTFVPTAMPTKEPTTVPTFEDCIHADDIIDGITLSIQRDYANKRIGITLVQELQYEPADPWFGFGFGTREMNGTYAITVVPAVEGFDMQERILGASGTYDAPGEILDTDSIYDHYINNGMRYVTVIRDYTVDGLYDFERFMDCKRPTPTIPVIAAKGTTAIYNLDGTVSDPDGQSPEIYTYHGENRVIGTITNLCCNTPITTFYGMSTTFSSTFYDESSTTDEADDIIDETEKLTTKLCENGKVYTDEDDCADDTCDACGETQTCTVDPCGCVAVCDGSMGNMIRNGIVSVLMVITAWLLL